MYFCKDCGKEHAKWAGKCICGSWNSIVDVPKSDLPKTKDFFLTKDEDERGGEILTGIGEWDRVARLHSKSVFLIGGEPGVGKSTLMCQICTKKIKVLYLAGEEAVYNVKQRFERVCGEIPNVFIEPFFFIEDLEPLVIKYKPQILIVDSIYTTQSKMNQSIRDIVLSISILARKYNFCAVMVSHITKEGIISGPKSLEHMVDAVLYLEGDRYHTSRILRAIKNRFGATGEVGVFEFSSKGLLEIKNPIYFTDNNLSGNILFCAMSGKRPMIIEVQALVFNSQNQQTETDGLEKNKIRIIVAILQRRCGLNLRFQDVFAKTTCDIRINDSSVDLPLAIAIASSFKDKAVRGVFWGEIGLNGDIRPSGDEERRIKEAKKLNVPIYNGSEYKDLKQLLKKLELI